MFPAVEPLVRFCEANAAPLIWLAVALVLFVVEAVTVQMVCIWFCVGAVAALAAAMLGAGPLAQSAVFVLVSALALLLTRKFVRNVLKFRRVPTNADAVIGQTGVTLEDIRPGEDTGRVYAAGLDWAARPETGELIPKDTRVIVTALNGVTLSVRPEEEKTP